MRPLIHRPALSQMSSHAWDSSHREPVGVAFLTEGKTGLFWFTVQEEVHHSTQGRHESRTGGSQSPCIQSGRRERWMLVLLYLTSSLFNPGLPWDNAPDT